MLDGDDMKLNGVQPVSLLGNCFDSAEEWVVEEHQSEHCTDPILLIRFADGGGLLSYKYVFTDAL